MSANTGINGVLLTGISQINGITVTGSSKNVAGAILNFGGASGTTTTTVAPTTTTTTASGTTTTTTAGTGGGGGGTAYAVRLFGDPGKGGSGYDHPGRACMENTEGFPVNGFNDLYLDGVDSSLGQVTVFFDVGLTTPFTGLDDNTYYYVDCRSTPQIHRSTLLSQQGAGDGWVYLTGPCS